MATRFEHYLYKGEKYYTISQIRRAVWNEDRKLFAVDPSDKMLEDLGVKLVYSEFAIPVETEDERREREAKEELERAKENRAAEVENIIVEVDGMMFDGDEISQGRMTRMLVALQAMNAPADQTVEWVLADNTVAQVTSAHLAEALVKAGMAQSAVWANPYKTEE